MLNLFESQGLHRFFRLYLQFQEVHEWKQAQHLMNILYDKDPGTFWHSMNVAFLSEQLAITRKNSNSDRIFLAALLHDIGKITIDNHILQGTSLLTQNEKKQMQFPYTGFIILKAYNFNKDIQHAALSHHERMDGSGYPNNASNIPYIARLVAIADVYCALLEVRPYRKTSFTMSSALQYFNNQRDLFDYDILKSLKVTLQANAPTNSSEELLSGEAIDKKILSIK